MLDPMGDTEFLVDDFDSLYNSMHLISVKIIRATNLRELPGLKIAELQNF